METFSALLALCEGNSPVTGEFLAQRPVTRSFDVFFDLRLNKRLSKQSWCRWFETQSRPLWRHCYGYCIDQFTLQYSDLSTSMINSYSVNRPSNHKEVVDNKTLYETSTYKASANRYPIFTSLIIMKIYFSVLWHKYHAYGQKSLYSV